MAKKTISRFKILGLVFLGGLTTSFTHRFKFYDDSEIFIKHQNETGALWTHQGLPFPFHHEALGVSGFAIHDWILFLFDTVFWASLWILPILLVMKIIKKS